MLSWSFPSKTNQLHKVNFSSTESKTSTSSDMSRSGDRRRGPSNNFGEWQQHTKGIGSKLMQKMGYSTGQGVGKNNEGITEPVTTVGNKGRSGLGATSDSSTKSKTPKKKDFKYAHDTSSEDDDSSIGEAGPAVTFVDLALEEDEESIEYITKRLLASNENLIEKVQNELRTETANYGLLKKSISDLESELKSSQDLILSYRGTLNTITFLETIYRNDRLDLQSLWHSLSSSLNSTTRCYLIQVFALPLLKKSFSKIRSSSFGNSLDVVDLEKKLFSDMIDVAREWLKTKSCYNKLITWYLEWMNLLKDLLNEDRVKYFRRRLLDVMFLATIKNSRDLNSFKYVTYEEYLVSNSQTKQSSTKGRYDSERGNETELMNFRQFVEFKALEHGLLFRPLEGRTHESKQLYKLEKTSLFISDKVIFVRKNDQWTPKTITEVLDTIIKQ